MSLVAAVDLQDDLLKVCNDLERLQGLLSSAANDLGGAFHDASAVVAQYAKAVESSNAEGMLEPLKNALARATTALQFDDMATQLLTHTRLLLRNRADRLAVDAFGDDGEESIVQAAPQRSNPVTQDEMDAGSVDLF
jgi:hypothetical protein